MEFSKKPRLYKSLRSAADLVSSGLIAPEQRASIDTIAARYAIAIPPEMVRLIDANEPSDPIALQFLPTAAELHTEPHELVDPIGDEAHSPVKGIVHRYPDRVLLKLLHICPVYCRFCFRREVVGPDGAGTLTAHEQQAALDYIAANPQIFEVILTGGDPLMLSERRIAAITSRLGAIDHVKVVRWHSRVPVVAPERITPALVKALTGHNKASYIAIHANHPRELMPAACDAIGRLRKAGITLLSQTVLLKGVNDKLDILSDLMRNFVANGIKPYYLHHLDPAPGTSHFATTIAEGQALMRGLQGRLSGLCIPTYVLDIEGGHGKAPVGPGYATQNPDGSWNITDYQGQIHGKDDCS